MKIAFFGMGGVGGYIAAKMCNHFSKNNDIEFYFIARGQHLEAIKNSGLTLTDDAQNTITVHPTLATDNCTECPKMDYVVYATKSYSVDSSLDQLAALCNQNTTLVTFMNGVDGFPMIKNALPTSNVHQGCIYIFSCIEAAGRIHEKGDSSHCFVGSEESNPALEKFYEMAKAASIKITYEHNITERIWRKYSRISVFATTTTHHNITCGQIKDNDKYMAEYMAIAQEFHSIATAMGALTDNSPSDNIKMLETSPYDATSSMQRDYHAGKQSELESLTGYIVAMGDKLGIETPAYDKAYTDLKSL